MKLFTILLNIAKRIKASFTRLTSLETWQSGVADYVVEYGTNYIKFANGIGFCWGNTGVSIGQGLLYADTTITFPFTFNGTGYQVLYGGITSTGAQHNVPVPVTHTKNVGNCLVRVWRNISTSYDGQPWFSWFAIGKWK